MPVADFEYLLRQRIGLDAQSVGPQLLARALLERQAACRLSDRQAYWEHVNGSESELQELIEAVVVPETWFFRDRQAFAALATHARDEWLSTHPSGQLRLLSVPCATGEEPYSMAMQLLDAGVPADRFSIDAADISERALRDARRAIYGKNSFRSGNLEFRDRHFEPSPLGYQLSDVVRGKVVFQHSNLFDAHFLPGSAIYDVIFCRNVLIYFDRAGQQSVLGTLRRLLTPEGLLFVGPAEAGLVSSSEFASARVPLAFAFRKVLAVQHAAKARAVRRESAALRKPAPHPTKPTTTKPTRLTTAAPEKVSSPSKTEPSIEAATVLADQGRLQEASRVCAEHLRLNGPSAPAFHLLGLLSEASGNTREAAERHRKALYLQPDHLEALLHLALLLDKQGDAAGAEIIRNRARRLGEKGGK